MVDVKPRPAVSARPFAYVEPFPDLDAERIPLVHAFRHAAMNWTARRRESASPLGRIGALVRGKREVMVAAECGVYKGYALVGCAKIAQDLGVPLRLFGLDTFAGLPPPSKTDLDFAPADAPYRRSVLFSDVSLAEVQQRCADNGVAASITLVPGLFHDTMPRLPEQRYDFVCIDCDLYEPHLECLEYFYPRLNKGGIAFFDDYYSAYFPQARAAVDRFMADKPERLFHLRYGVDGVNHTKCFFSRL